jgi:hypothetical protein
MTLGVGTTADVQECPPFLSALTSRRTDDVEPSVRAPIGSELYSLILSEWLSRFVVSSDIVLPTPEAANETVPVEAGSDARAASVTLEQERAFAHRDDECLALVQLEQQTAVVKMPPRREYSITLRLGSVGRAQPNIVEPNWDWTES